MTVSDCLSSLILLRKPDPEQLLRSGATSMVSISFTLFFYFITSCVFFFTCGNPELILQAASSSGFSHIFQVKGYKAETYPCAVSIYAKH